MKQHIFIRCGKISMAASGGMIVANYFLGSMKPLTLLQRRSNKISLLLHNNWK